MIAVLKINTIEKGSTKSIEIFYKNYNSININIEYYERDNLLFPNHELENPYKFECYKRIFNKNDINFNRNYRGYQKILKLKNKPKKLKNVELLLHLCNNNLQLLSQTCIISRIGFVVEEEFQDFIISFVEIDHTETRKINKKNYRKLEEFNLNKIFTLNLLVKVGSFNQIEDLYYTTDCVIKNELLL